jgi:hypothetical protein
MTVDSEYIRNKIDVVREQIGRTVTFNVRNLTPCTLCTASGYYDAVNNITTYFTCPVCAGQFYMPNMTATEVLARIHWTNDEQVTATPGGKHYLGQCYIHIEPEYLPLAESTQSEAGTVIVDNHTMHITKILPIGAPTINRYRLILVGDGSRPE